MTSVFSLSHQSRLFEDSPFNLIIDSHLDGNHAQHVLLRPNQFEKRSENFKLFQLKKNLLGKKTLKETDKANHKKTQALYEELTSLVIEDLKSQADSTLKNFDSPIQNEHRDLEWLQVSLEVLKKAYQKASVTVDQIVEYEIQYSDKELRLNCYNLHFHIKKSEDFSQPLKIVVFNTKNQKTAPTNPETQSPVIPEEYNLNFANYAPIAINEFIKLLILLKSSSPFF